MPAAFKFTPEQEMLMRDGVRSQASLAAEFGCSTMPIRNWRRRHGITSAGQRVAAPASPLGTAGTHTTDDGVVTATSEPLCGGVQDAESYLRERWGLPVDTYALLSVTGNEWQGPVSGGGVATYGQVKGTFRKIADIQSFLPKPAVYRKLPRPRVLRAPAATSWQMVLLADHQAPYHDEALLAAQVAMAADLQPRRIGHLGDLCDFTDISKHRDHAVVNAKVNECIQAGHDILRALREAAPHAEFELLWGNHDVRPFTELLGRAERMADIRCADMGDGDREALVSLERALRLPELGIKAVTDSRGWDHAELDIVPGSRGLSGRHGWLTGKNVAARTLEKVGRSVVVGHIHRPEHVYSWSKQLHCEQQAVVVGCSCEVRGGGNKHFPTFVPEDDWLQGAALVTVWPDQEFTIELARWTGDSLVIGSRRWSA